MLQNNNQSGAGEAAAPIARDDVDALPAGSMGPETGSAISGAGTLTGASGADTIANAPGAIVALQGAGGAVTSDTGGSLQVDGQYGVLTLDAQGSYSYVRSAGTPDGVQDVFTYTLADADGQRDDATLTIQLLRDPTVESAQLPAGTQMTTADGGVVMLPAGVELADIRVIGRDLVVTLPDGSTMVIPGGAVFVPQLVIGDVEVPASNLAALLIESEPQPAAGTPDSSGGNFEVPVAPLDPGVPLGDLIPPTELDYTPPVFEEVGQVVDDEPEIFIQPDGQPASVNAVDSVDEAGLPPRGSEPQGSGEEAAAGTNGDTSETVTGTIIVDSPDGPNVVTINGVAVTAVGQVIAGTYGNLTVTSIGDGTIGYSYTLLDNTAGDATEDGFTVTVTDQDGDTATATLTIDIVDDVPTARADTDSIAAGEFGPATGNVMTDASEGDLGDGDNGRDTVGADDAEVTSVSGEGGSDSSFNENGDLVVAGEYGVLTIDAAGNYSYVRNEGTPGGVTDTFSYTITDGDGDPSTSTLTIDIGDLPVTVGENPTVLLDDDALAGGNPGGIGDDPDAANLTGTLAGSGGDGDLSFSLQTAGAPAGFTYVAGPDGSVLVQQGGVTVLTVTVDADTGEYSVTQNAPIDHPAGSDENNVSFTIDYVVTDADGDEAAGSLTINVDDDTPEIGRVDIGAPTLLVDETDLAANASGDFSTLFDVDYGADGAGTTEFTLDVTNGTDSGLVDVATGDPILLFDNNGVIEGRVGGADGAVAFTVSVSDAGVVTLDQLRPLDHPDATDHDDSVSPDEGTIGLTVTATDADGDPVSESIDIGGNLVFDDDGPTVSNVVAGDGVTLDETDAGSPEGFPISATSIGAAIDATTAFGADGAGTVAYGLSLPGGSDSGLATAIGDHPITLVLVDSNTIEGRYEDGGTQVAFTIEMNADGTVTVTQNVPLEHLVDGSSAAAHDDALDLSGLVNATVTVTDRDGDTASGEAAIGDNIVFEDDGPSIAVSAGGEAEVTLVTDDAETIGTDSDMAQSEADFSGVFDLTFDGGADGAAGTPDLNYTLGLQTEGGPSGLTQGNAIIYLHLMPDGTVVGSTSSSEAGVTDANTVFDVTVDADGVVTLNQYSQIDHPAAGDPDGTDAPFDDHIVSLADDLITLTASGTVTDNDGDTASDSATVNIGANLQFTDDGPDVSAVLTGTLLEIDETDGETAGAEVDPVGGNLGTVTVAAATLFTVANPHASADSPTTYDYALTLSSQGVESGLLLSTTDAPIFLYEIGGTVYGSTAADIGDVDASNTAFTVTIDADTGAVTMTQFLAVEHDNTASHDEDSSGLNPGALDVTVTATDSDGDTDEASVDLGSVIRFEDDGPSIDVTASGEADVTLVTDDADTIGTDSDMAQSTADFSGVFDLAFDGGSDGAASTPDLGYTLDVTGFVTGGPAGVDSGLSQGGDTIYLYEIGGTVVGSTSATLAGVLTANTVFDVTVDGEGVVTLNQYSQIDHPAVDDPDGTDAPFDDHIVSIADDLITLTASATVTDNDEDTASDSATVGIGANLQFTDDGPVARPDTDSVAEGGSTIGNVLTGTGTTSGAGGADSPGADGYASTGAVIAITSVNMGTSDITADGMGNFVLMGEWGTLTLNENGSYTYEANADSDPTEPDLFTYTIIDADGDTSTATLTINVQDVTLTPDNDTVTVNEAALDTTITGDDVAAGSVTGSNPGSTAETVTGTLMVAGATEYTLDSPAVGTYGTLELNADGTYTYTLTQPFDSTPDADDGTNTELGAETFTYTATDANGNSVQGTITVNIIDDVPSIDVTADADAGVVLQTDDAETIGATSDDASSTADFSGVFDLTFNAGADGAAATPDLDYTLDVTGFVTGGPAGVDSGLEQGGDTIYLYEIGGKVVGSTSATLAGVLTANTVFDVSVDADGVVTLTQYSQIDHPAEGPPGDTDAPFADQIASLADDLVTLTASGTVTDNDGDTDTDSATVNIGANLQFTDDGPDISATLTGTEIRIDETDGVVAAGGEVDPAGGDLGTVTVPAASLFTVSNVHVSADSPTTLSYALAVSAQGVASGLLLSSSDAPILLYEIGGTVYGSTATDIGDVDPSNTAFTVSIDADTGAVTMTQFLGIEHGDTASHDEDSGPITSGALTATVTATDFDGDTDEASVDLGSVIVFEDDGPRFGAVDEVLMIDNDDMTPSATGDFEIIVGSDSPVAANNVITNVTFAATVAGQPVTNPVIGEVSETATTAIYEFSFDYATGPDTTATATGTLTFNKADGTYTVELDDPIASFDINTTSQGTLFQGYEPGTSTPDGSQPAVSVTQVDDDLFVQFTGIAEPASGTGSNNLFTTEGTAGSFDNVTTTNFGDLELFTQTSAWVSTSNDANGVAGDTIQGGEVLDFNLYETNPFGNLNMEPTASAEAMFFKLDGVGSSEDFIVILKLYDTSTGEYTTQAVMVQNGDIIKGPGAGPGIYSGVTLDNNDGLVIIEANDYQQGNENLVIVGAQIAGSDEGVTGTAINLNSAIGEAGESSGTQAFSTDTDNGPFKISDIGFVTESSTNQEATLTFDVTVQDADGDTAEQTLTVNIGETDAMTLAAATPVQEAFFDKSASLVSDSSVEQEQLLKSMNAANSNAVFLGAIAGAGLTAAPAAAATPDFRPLELIDSIDLPTFEAVAAVRSAEPFGGALHGNESFETAADAAGTSAARFASDSKPAQSADFGGSESSDGSAALSQLSQGTDAAKASVSEAAPVADAIAMPSAEALAAALGGAPAEVQAKVTGEVGRALADALSGGEQGPSIDALLDGLPVHGQPGADLAAIATDAGAGVSAWDMGGFAAFGHGQSGYTVEALILHQDGGQASAA